MRFSFILTSFFVIFTSITFAQNKTDRAHVEWGPDLTDKKDGSFSHVFGNTDEHVYMIVRRKKEAFVQKMDLNSKVIYQKLLPMKIDKAEHSLERISVFGDRILVFSQYFDKKQKMNELYLRIFDAADMSPQGRLQKIASIDVESKRAQGGFSMSISPDEKNVLVGVQLPFVKDNKEQFTLKVFNEDMILAWEQDVVLPYMDNEFSVEQMRVANDGSVVVVGVKYAEKREAKAMKKEGKASYTYHLLTYDPDGGAPEDHALEVTDRFLQDLTLDLGNEGDILAGGFYGMKGTHAIHGVFFLRLDRKTKAILHSSFKEFGKDFITQYMTEKEEKKATKKAEKKGEDLEMYQFDLDDLVRRTDGGAVMVGEQYYEYQVTTCTTSANGGQTCRTTYHYVYNDIIVVNIDPAGNIEWAAKVPKRQHTVNDGGYYSSYALAVKEDRIYLMFNDSGKNLFLSPGQKVEPFKLTGKEALITLATIDADGNVSREALLAPDRRDAIARPRSCVQLTDDRMFIYASRKNDHRYGSVVFQ